MLRATSLGLWVGIWTLVVAQGDVCPHAPLSGPSGCLGDATRCVNGNCRPQPVGVENGTWLIEVCDCLEGWTGPECDVCCHLPCQHGRCKGTSKTDLYCECDVGYTSENCSISMLQPVKNCSSDRPSTTPTQCGTIQCYNGNCTKTEVIPGFSLDHCICEPGWEGVSCEMCCNLPCDHGICWLTRDKQQPYCACRAGYSGKYCDQLTRVSLPPPGPRPGGNESQSSECNATARNKADQCIGIQCYNGFCARSHRNISGKLMEVGHCECDSGWTGHKCESCCDLPCIDGVCEINFETKEMYCNCFYNYTGVLCNATIPPPEVTAYTGSNTNDLPFWTWTVIAVIMLLLLSLIAVVVYGLYILRTKPYELPKSILRMVHHFSNENDDKKFDAFVSYRSSREDQNFVVHQLMNKLEGQMGYKICFHARNFLPGRTIAENILEAVQNSRRTILVVSPDYLQAEWPRYEYQVAHEEMLRINQKHRIIPIIFKDIRSVTDMDPVLEQIIQSITYLPWPGHEDKRRETKFWEDLKLSMPRVTQAERDSALSKRHNQQTEKTSMPTTAKTCV